MSRGKPKGTTSTPTAPVGAFRIPAPGQRSAIPPVIGDYFASIGKSLSWQRHSPDNLSFLFGLGLVPVRIEDLGDQQAVTSTLRQAFQVNPEGYIQLGDTILCAQPTAQREAILAQEAEITRIRESGTAVNEAFQRDLDEAARSVNSRRIPRYGGLPDASEHFT